MIGANALFQDDLPIHKEIAEAAKNAGVSYPPQQLAEGSIAGMVIEAALKAAGSSATPAKLAEAMPNLKVDLEGPARRPARVDQEQSLPRTRQY